MYACQAATLILLSFVIVGRSSTSPQSLVSIFFNLSFVILGMAALLVPDPLCYYERRDMLADIGSVVRLERLAFTADHIARRFTEFEAKLF